MSDNAERRLRLPESVRPLLERLGSFVADPRLRSDLKILVPSLALFLILLITLRSLGSGPMFWLFAVVGGAAAYSLLQRADLRRYVNVEIYRTVLFTGLAIVMISVFRSAGPMFVPSVEVQSKAANIRTEPSTDSAVVTTVSEGDDLTVLERAGTWVRVKTDDGQTGWVYSTLVSD